MKILIPRNLDLLSTLNFCNIMDEIQDDRSYVYDYEQMNTVEPFGMLLIGSKIRFFVNSKENCAHIDKNFENSGYAAHMGFFKSIFIDFGKSPGEAKGNGTYVPISKINFEEVKNNGNIIDIYEYIENISKKLSEVLSIGNKSLASCLSYSIIELIRNVYEHSESKELWYAGQYWPTKDLVEIAILDEGIGIKNSLKKNKIISVNDDEEAIRLALKPGISNSGIGRSSKDCYDNIGFGLYMISNICKEAGNFVICSGSKCLELNQTGISTYETSFNGTAIRMRIHPSKSEKILSIMNTLSKLGNEKASEYKNINEISIESVGND